MYWWTTVQFDTPLTNLYARTLAFSHIHDNLPGPRKHLSSQLTVEIEVVWAPKWEQEAG